MRASWMSGSLVAYGAGLVLLAAALAATWGLRSWRVAEVEARLGAARQARAEQALDTAEAAFDELVREVCSQARALARNPEVARGLRGDPRGEPAEGLTRIVAAQPLGARTSLEVYAPALRLVAWKGPSLPVRGRAAAEAREAPGGGEGAVRTTVVADGEVRYALAAWAPVRASDVYADDYADDRAGNRAGNRAGEAARASAASSPTATLGLVRVSRVVRFLPPIQNQYVRAYSLAATWSRTTALPVEVELGPEVGRADVAGRLVRPLTAPDGTVLGRVLVRLPAPARLLADVRGRYDDVLMVWLTLLLFWVAGLTWELYRRARPDAGGRRRDWLRAAACFVLAAAFGWGLRYALLALDVPARWQPGRAPLAPLFDPTHLASTFGGGLMRSTGDLLITSGFAAVFTVGFLDLAARRHIRASSLEDLVGRLSDAAAARPSSLRFVGVLVVTTLALLGLVLMLARLVHHAVLDSTLDFFSRTGFLPSALVFVVLSALLLLTVAAVLTGVGTMWIALRLLVRYRPTGWPRGTLPLGVALVMLTTGGLAYWASGAYAVVALPVVASFYGVTTLGALVGSVRRPGTPGYVTLRGLLPALALLTLVLYPILYHGMDMQRRGRMVDAARSYEEGRDPRILFALDQVLDGAQTGLGNVLGSGGSAPARLDSSVTRLLRGAFIATLPGYDAYLVVFDTTGTPAARYPIAGGPPTRRAARDDDRRVFERLRAAYAQRTGTPLDSLSAMGPPLVDHLRADDPAPAPPLDARFQYAGLAPLGSRGRRLSGWMLVRATPRSLLPGAGTSFPRVLLPDGSYRDLYARLSVAAFRDGVLVRALGRDFERAQLAVPVRRALNTRRTLWRHDEERGRRYLTHYRVQPDGAVVAVRIPAVMSFDHLYYLLRLVVAGLVVGGLFYLIGLWVRYRRGLLPAPRVRFRDKVLNAFLVVGVVTVLAVGTVGVQVVTGESTRVTERQLQEHLERVEEALALEAGRDVPIYRLAASANLDSLAARVGLDLSLYDGGRLVATNRPRLVQDRFVEPRLPARVYRDLYADGFRFTTSPARIGDFAYTVGYRALPDAEGRPRYVLAVPTLPQQERIVEEQARTLAYLFGALLLLVVTVMVTALLIASALAQPIAQLRAGLEAVGEGRFTQKLPVHTRDEIGQLVETFNDMQAQLADSRRKLAQQERKLAWREMARQVAHEIKNPLTPMKLSVQHMRRAFERSSTPLASGDGAQTEPPAKRVVDGRFTRLFERVTGTLIEQIDTLARIANEFSTFARMPTRVPEPLDLNAVASEAVALMEAEAEAAIEAHLADAPLVVQADREELRRIYINLLKNALQAIPDDRDGRIVVTSARATAADGTPVARSTVADNGTGIPPDLRDKIFQPNFSTKTSGTGLGLAIARKSLDELGGAIGFETEEGQGTTFWLELPLRDADAPAARALPPAPAETQGREA